jgi:hypothetical protein
VSPDEFKRLLHEALDAHDTAILAMQRTRVLMREVASIATELAQRVEAARATADVAIDGVLHANKTILEALNQREKQQ